MNRRLLTFSTIVLMIILSVFGLSGCSKPDETIDWDSIKDITVKRANASPSTFVGTEDFPLPNCGSAGEVSYSLGTQTHITTEVSLGSRATASSGVEISFPLAFGLKLEAAVEGTYQTEYNIAKVRLDNIVMKAPGKTAVKYVVNWWEEKYESEISFPIGNAVYTVPYGYCLCYPKLVDTLPVACPVPDILTFKANPPTINKRGSATLDWNVNNADRVTIIPECGDVESSGTKMVSPAESTIYTLTAMNEYGESERMVSVNIKEVETRISYFTASRTNLNAGDSCVLSWSVSDAERVVINPGIGKVELTGTETIFPTETTTYTLTAENDVGETSITEITVTVTSPKVKLTIKAIGHGSTIPDQGTYSYNKGQQVTITANPFPGYYFDRWEGVVPSTSLLTTITMDGDKVITARFAEGFSGNWENEDPNTGGITKVVNRYESNKVFVHMWGSCTPTDCDWGETSTDLQDTTDKQISITWIFSFKVETQTLTLLEDGRLKVYGLVHYTDSSGRSDRNYVHYFTRKS